MAANTDSDVPPLATSCTVPTQSTPSTPSTPTIASSSPLQTSSSFSSTKKHHHRDHHHHKHHHEGEVSFTLASPPKSPLARTIKFDEEEQEGNTAPSQIIDTQPAKLLHTFSSTPSLRHNNGHPSVANELTKNTSAAVDSFIFMIIHNASVHP